MSRACRTSSTIGCDFSGDGTVPTARAMLAGCEAWYCQVPHNELMRSKVVHDAVLQLLADAAPQLSHAPPTLVQPSAWRIRPRAAPAVLRQDRLVAAGFPATPAVPGFAEQRTARSLKRLP